MLAGGKHVAVDGDTLSRIASRYGMKLRQILDLNPEINNPDIENSALVIPAFSSSGSAMVAIDINFLTSLGCNKIYFSGNLGISSRIVLFV